jgi:hypothetical protein
VIKMQSELELRGLRIRPNRETCTSSGLAYVLIIEMKLVKLSTGIPSHMQYMFVTFVGKRTQ